jgi:hypothetical protein
VLSVFQGLLVSQAQQAQWAFLVPLESSVSVVQQAPLGLQAQTAQQVPPEYKAPLV